MPNKPDPYKRIVNARIDRELYEKLKKLAASCKTTMSDLITNWIFQNTKHIQLDEKDYEEIAQQIREAKKKINPFPTL